MPQDKRLIITKAVLYKLQRLCEEEKRNPGQEGIFLSFVLPSVVLAQVPELLHPTTPFLFNIPHNVYKGVEGNTSSTSPSEQSTMGRTTCLIVPKQIAYDCTKINKRHAYYNAVITAEAICRSGDAETHRRALKVANTFTHFVVDSRIVAKLPACILEAVRKPNTSTTGDASKGKRRRQPRKFLIPLSSLGERENLTFHLAQGSNSVILFSASANPSSNTTPDQTNSGATKMGGGALWVRVGHGNMTAGEICENAKSFIHLLRKNFPHVMKYVNEFKLVSDLTDSIRFIETQITK